MNVAAAIVVNSIVISIIAILVILAIIHLIRVYKKSPCGDCSEAKHCTTKSCEALSKKNIFKAYKKAVKEESKNKNI